MPVYRNRSVVKFKGMNLFINLEMGATRGDVTYSELASVQAQAQIQHLQDLLAAKERELELHKRQGLASAHMQQATGDAAEQIDESDPIAVDFRRLAPWISKFVINGKTYGGDAFDPGSDDRIDQFFEFFPEPKRILELGSFEGGHTVRLAQGPSVEQVVGIEGRQLNVERATLIRRLLGATNVEFVLANLETADLTSFGDFDTVFCCGILYHLPRPWEILEQIARVSSQVFIWTHYTHEEAADTTANGYEGRFLEAAGLSHPLGGMSSGSFWPTRDSLHRMLADQGFDEIHTIKDDPDHIDGPAITLGLR